MSLDPLKGSPFIPLGKQADPGFQESALGVLAKRQSIIASNIANADTPQYKAVDIDFASALHDALANAHHTPVALNLTAASHIPAHGNTAPFPDTLRYHQPYQASVDGNTVEMDVERSKFSENAVRYEFAVQQVGSEFKEMIQMFTSLT
ncbi:flagellar basal-body rod protein [Oryzomicrobium terrae]|uniref:Flagellar basal body rod protein FlgB n=1 Tax=Oryzomicrobium terrae TaxID=1735038 RepID=A0A5C1E3H7_9RHOO|nr:flagellar basal body rod protein FlgB [Oryzomicrobium terrae]QEL63486.1 flagellar basal-body rod protein [Oryzomicrobium terrae]